MATFRLGIASDREAADAWRRILDLRAHSRVIPLTSVTGDAMSADGLVAGSRFVARTAVGRFGFDDPMVIEEIIVPVADRAGLARILKEGNVIRGSIELRVVPGPSGSTVEWRQDIRVRGVPAPLDPLVAFVGRQAYAAAIRRLLAPG